MERYIVHGGIGMARGSLARIVDGKGLALEVWDGELWITQERDPRDYFIRPGERFEVKREGLVLAYALRAKPHHAHGRRAGVLRAPHHADDAGRARPSAWSTTAPVKRPAGSPGLGHRLARFWANAYASHSNPTTAAL